MKGGGEGLRGGEKVSVSCRKGGWGDLGVPRRASVSNSLGRHSSAETDGDVEPSCKLRVRG